MPFPQTKTFSAWLQASLLIPIYTAVILVIVLLSSTFGGRRTLYDKYLAKLEGAEFVLRDSRENRLFYTQVLDFKPLMGRGLKEGEIIAYQLPLGNKLYVKDSTKDSPSNTKQGKILLQVRNGYSLLHREIRRKFKEHFANTPHSANSLAQISKSNKYPWGREFIAQDFDGNQIIFFKRYHQ